MYQRHRTTWTFGGHCWTKSGCNRSLCYQSLLLRVTCQPCLTLRSTSTSWQPQRRILPSKYLLPSRLPVTTVSIIVLCMIAAFIQTPIDIHAFIAWFDIVFECTHKKVKFSTGPHAQYTHWKYVCNPALLFGHSILLNRQTVFYTPSTITITDGQEITGEVSCSPNARNNRDLDITISYSLGEEKENIVVYKMCVIFSFFSYHLFLQCDSWW